MHALLRGSPRTHGHGDAQSGTQRDFGEGFPTWHRTRLTHPTPGAPPPPGPHPGGLPPPPVPCLLRASDAQRPPWDAPCPNPETSSFRQDLSGTFQIPQGPPKPGPNNWGQNTVCLLGEVAVRGGAHGKPLRGLPGAGGWSSLPRPLSRAWETQCPVQTAETETGHAARDTRSGAGTFGTQQR